MNFWMNLWLEGVKSQGTHHTVPADAFTVKRRVESGRGGLREVQADGAYVLEGLAASGLRAIRYASEVEGVGRVDANDLDPAVVEAMRRNIAFNGGAAAQRVRPRQGDARMLMMQNAGVRAAFSQLRFASILQRCCVVFARQCPVIFCSRL